MAIGVHVISSGQNLKYAITGMMIVMDNSMAKPKVVATELLLVLVFAN
jgi:hypothetical protein